MTSAPRPAFERPSPVWLGAIVAWSSFIGAAVVTMLLLVLGPRLNSEGFSWALLGRWFLLCWITCLVPVICTLVLISPPRDSAK
ncbi:MAG: hypothetical protein JWQ90_3804 [Hydrocarboniphaga sp.]|uniref:hypothetical protein n=1 Tax=Hydrocarboniphaga sp. TaxID=2033016 RepID=UPI00261F1F01|nr:hypothetical protein [Hydrocarboniphaga sp.]MDB5971354.1 hypothetical protein [Hydrocarboniphaga sp.]